MATALTLRQNKGSPLTFKEGDDNFLYLDSKIDAVSATTKIYASKEAGLAATKDSDTFWVVGSGDVATTLYRRVNSTTATELASSLSTQFKADLADPAKGAAMIGIGGGFTQADRNKQFVYADEYGLKGDGSDETEALDRFFADAKGKSAVLGEQKSYGYNPNAGGVHIRSLTNLITNGSRFVETTPSSDYQFIIDGGVQVFGDINVDFLGETNSRGVWISGNVTKIFGAVNLISLSPQCGAGNIRRRALKIGTEGGAETSDVHIEKINIKNWDYGIAAFNTVGLSIGFIGHDTYRAGLWLMDAKDCWIYGGRMFGLSASSVGAPGENGVLIESSVHHGSTNIRVWNMVVEDSGEHGFRIGGSRVASNITHVSCKTKNTGAADGSGIEPEDHGGCGFKCLGPTVVPGAYHQDIRYIDCIVEDVKWSSKNGNNFSGFSIGKTQGYSIINPIVRTSIKDDSTDPRTPPAYSCENGIEIIGCLYGTISNPIIIKPAKYGVMWFDITDSNDWGSENSHQQVNGGMVLTPGEAGFGFFANKVTFRRLRVNGCHVEGGKYHSIASKASTGNFVLCAVAGSYANGSGTIETINGLDQFQVAMSGAEVGNNNCQNGSTFQSFTAGTLKLRKSGAWVPL